GMTSLEDMEPRMRCRGWSSLLVCAGAAVLAAGCAAPAGGAGGNVPARRAADPPAARGDAPATVLAVHTPPGDQALAATLRAGRFFRRAVPHLAGVRVEMGPRAAEAGEVRPRGAGASESGPLAAGVVEVL